MGFTWTESSQALKRHGTLEEAVDSLFGDGNPGGKCLKMCLRVRKLTCHFRDVLVFETLILFLYLFFGFFQKPVPVETIPTNGWCRKKITTTVTMGESGSSNKQAVPERSRSESLKRWAKAGLDLSHRPLIQDSL